MTDPQPESAGPLQKKARFSAALLAGLLLLGAFAALLRGWGLGWGVPHAGRYYPYHPDEVVLLHATCQVSPLWLDFTPGLYNYGSFFMVLARLAFDLAAPALGWGSVPQYGLPFDRWVDDYAHLLWVGRLLTVALGVGTVLLTVWLGRLLYSARAGWVGGVLAAVAPILVLFGHYMTVDVPGTFFTTLALGCAAASLVRVRAGDGRGALRWLAGAGVAAGLAAGVKYNGGVALLSAAVPLWALWRSGEKRAAVVGAVLTSAAAGVVFLASTPGVLLETDRFLADFTYEVGRNQAGQGMIFHGTPPAALYHLQVTLPVALEWPLYLLVLAGVGWSVWKRRAEDVLLWLFIGSTFLALAGAERKFIRYLTPLIPPLVLLAGRAVDEGLRTRGRHAWAAAGALAGLAALGSSVAHLGVLSAPDSRDLAAAYLKANGGRDALVALGSDPFTYTPPIHPTAGCVKLGALYGGPPIWEQDLPESAPPRPFPLADFRILAPRPNTGALAVPLLRQYRPDFVVLSDYEYEDPERLAGTNPDHPLLRLRRELDSSYRVAAEFRPRPSLFGFTWWRRGIPPHDWRYYMPTVRIYQRPALELSR